MIEDQIVAHLQADPAVTALANGRIYAFGEVPQGINQPYVSYQLIGGPARQDWIMEDGSSVFWYHTYQLDCYAPRNSGASAAQVSRQLAEAVRNSLDRKMFAGTPKVPYISWDNWRDLPEADWARRQVDFVFHESDPP